ncbi:hypothetical protein [Paenibacillus wynnii]|uniref:hypothetical protein n=1 Tax=Paenibacillus wynnii TaxID=268407 RepID=UPI0009FDF88F|nr:hypothetical protein [Paenibacillus wynnii]
MINLNSSNSPYKERQIEIINKIALEAERMPLLDSGLWFHDDVRNNFYYASYLFAATANASLQLPFDREDAKQKAEHVLMETLMLQNRKPGTVLYGHWPLGLHPIPREAAPHELPVEIMGSLIAYFNREYGGMMSARLRVAFNTALGHIYRSKFYLKPVVTFGHHEAKHTAAKLIFGKMFEDDELVEDGRQSLKDTLLHIKSKGMPEYGCLPWFWHWVQAFTCALELGAGEDIDLRNLLREMLNYLWNERAQFYLQGAWVGARSRGWPHDVPGDANVLHDYVQFGDFQLPEGIPRTEYAGFLFYEAPEQIRAAALNRSLPVEITKITEKVAAGDPNRQPPLHSYVYITKEYAAGGMWERVEEFDNEQLRWAYSLPLRGGEFTNQLYFFHPGPGYKEGDPRHQSRHAEVLYHQNVILTLYPVPAGEVNTIIGVLPKGQWLQQPSALYGLVDQVYFAIFLSHSYSLKQQARYLEVTVDGMPGGVTVEAVSVEKAVELGISGLDEFAAAMTSKAPFFSVSDSDSLQVDYTSTAGDCLQLLAEGDKGAKAIINSSPVSFEGYRV